jgi:hypothetical protein
VRDILQPVDQENRTALDMVERITSAELVKLLRGIEGSAWGDWSNGRGRESGLPVSGLSRLLAPFGIGPRQLKFDGRNQRGYELRQFLDAFARNLPSNRYPATDDGDKGLTPGLQIATDAHGSGYQNGANPFDSRTSSGVAAKTLEHAGATDSVEADSSLKRKVSGPEYYCTLHSKVRQSRRRDGTYRCALCVSDNPRNPYEEKLESLDEGSGV